MKAQTWLPLFPGFYGTIFEANEESEIYNYNQENNTDYDYDNFKWDYTDYNNRIARSFTNRVESELNHLLPVKIKFESLYSPREYNFSNDSINCEITVSLTRLLKLIKERKKDCAEYCKSTYTSRSGFISFHSPDIEDWLKPEYIKENPSFRVGALLEMLLCCEISNDDIIYWCDGEMYINYEVKELQD